MAGAFSDSLTNRLHNEAVRNARSASWDLLAIFALALLIRLIYNLSGSELPLFSCDGSEYLRDAQALLALVQKGTSFQTLRDLSIAGPVFPLFIIFSCLIFGQAPTPDHAVPLLISQSIISALTSVFIAVIGRTCWNRRAGQIGGLIAALYPAFIINSGRLYSETFAVFLLSGLIVLVCRVITREPNLFVYLTAGVAAAALQLIRSSMVGISGASFLFITACLFRRKTPAAMLLKGIATAILGFSMLIVPWLCFSQTAFGTASMILDRASHYNFLVGNNVDSLGWLSVPYPDLSPVDKESFCQLASQAFHTSPDRWCKLLLDKPHRLFKFPWNDFRASLGPIQFHFQILLHQALLLLAAIGIGLCLFTRRLIDGIARPTEQFACRLFLLIVLCFHLTYLFFITVPRYNLSAMLVLIAFAAAGLTQLFGLLRAKEMQKKAFGLSATTVILFVVAHLSVQTFCNLTGLNNAPLLGCILLIAMRVIVSIVFFLMLWGIAASEFSLERSLEKRLMSAAIAMLAISTVIALAVPVRADGRLFEWQMKLPSPTSSLNTTIRLPAPPRNGKAVGACYLLLDADGARGIQEDAILRINGRRLTGPFIPGLSLAGDMSCFKARDFHQIYLECGYIFDCLSYPSKISNLDLRQWIYIPLPQDIVESSRRQGYMRLEISPAGAAPFCLFAQHVMGGHVLMPSLDRCSWEKAFYGVENDNGFSDPRYDLKLPAAAKDCIIPDVLLLSSNTDNAISAPSTVPTAVEHVSRQSLLMHSCVLPAYSKKDFWIIRMSGNIKPATRFSLGQTELKVGASVTSKSLPSQNPLLLRMTSMEWANQGRSYGSIKTPCMFTYNPPWVPRSITVGASGAPFDIAFPLIPSAMPGMLQTIRLTVSSESVPLELSGYKIEIYNLPSNPLSPPIHIQVPEGLSIVSPAPRRR